MFLLICKLIGCDYQKFLKVTNLDFQSHISWLWVWEITHSHISNLKKYYCKQVMVVSLQNYLKSQVNLLIFLINNIFVHEISKIREIVANQSFYYLNLIIQKLFCIVYLHICILFFISSLYYNFCNLLWQDFIDTLMIYFHCLVLHYSNNK